MGCLESSTEVRLAEALEALKAGDVTRARDLYDALLSSGCSDVRLFSNLGAMALQQGDAEAAVGWLERGVEIDPGHPRCRLNLGMALQMLDRNPEAIAAFRRTLELDPSLPEAWNNLAVALNSRLDRVDAGPERQPAIEEVLAAYRQALALNPHYGQAARNLAMLLANQGQPQVGEAVLRALPAEATAADEQFTLAEMLRLQGRIDEALALYAEALARAPDHNDLRLGVAIALVSCGQADQALIELLPLLAQESAKPRPMVAAGFALQSLGEINQAMEFYNRALAIDPTLVLARNLLGNCHNDLGEHSLAIEHFQAGLREAPQDLGLRCNLAGALRHQGDLAGSIREMDQLLADHPKRWEACLIQLFSYSISPESLAPRALEVAARYWQLRRQQPQQAVALNPVAGLPPLALANPASRPALPEAEAPIRSGEGLLRIGFLSAEIGDHVVGSFLFSFLQHHNRHRFAVELFAASRRFDASAERMVAEVDQHWLLSGMAPDAARALIRSRQLDILVETSGFTRDTAIDLLTERCAPVQCHYIGFHATTGLDTIDWFIGDEETVPESFAPQFVERLWRLPRPWLAREPDPSMPAALSEAEDDRPVLGSFNQLTKVREETLQFWLAALQAVPSARLLIKDRSTADAVVCDRIRSTLGSGGVAPERIMFLRPTLSWQEHMAAYNRMDVALDATPWSSATTGFDALAMGVPLVAIRGGCTSARMSSAILLGLGCPEWIAETPDRYGAVVRGLCADLAALRAGKQALRRQVLASPLFDGADLCRTLEQAFVAMTTISGR